MKFTVLYKCCDEVKKAFERDCVKGYGDGVDLIRLDRLSIINKNTNEFVEHVYAYRCKASIFNYLRHKALYGKYLTHIIGWKP